MPTTILSGLADTADPVAGEIKVDMRDQIAMIDPDVSQFKTILMKLPEERAKSYKVEWLEDRLIPRTSGLAASATSADTAFTVTTSTGSYFKAGDIVRIVTTGEAVRVTATGASALTVVRAIGTVAAASAASGGDGSLVIVGGSNEQGATLPTALITQRTAAYNYTSIVRNSYRFTRTMVETATYGSNPNILAFERKKKASEHAADLEDTLFYGARSYSAGTNNPRTTSGGLIEFVTTNVTSASTLDKGTFNDFMRTGLQYGSSNKVLFAAPIVAQVVSEFLGDNWVHAKPDERAWGAKVDAYISAIYGTSVPVIVKRQWGGFGSLTSKFYSTKAFLVDLEAVQFAPLHDSELLRNRQANDADEFAEEYLAEISLKVENETRHAILTDVVG